MRKMCMAIVMMTMMCGGVGAMAQELFERRVTPLMLSILGPAAQVPQATWDVQGLRLNLIYGGCHTLRGLDIGLINSCERMYGLQLGLINTVDVMKGLQIGFVNHANRAVGLQIGVINVISDNTFPFVPIINGSF